MLEKPDIPDHLITSCVQAEYGLDVMNVTFLPLGYDVNTAVYRIDTDGGASYFLKLRRGIFDPITVAVPKFLKSMGVQAIIAPVETQKGQLFGNFKNYTIILYPYISGKDGYQVELSGHHWVELGQTLRKVHTSQVPAALIPGISPEVYDPQWRDSVKRFQAQVEQVTFQDPTAEKLSTFMKAKRQEIGGLVSRADELAASLELQTKDFVLCHSDAHPGNFLIADTGELYLVDWDSPILAPKERDLMFFGSGMSGDPPGGRIERLFFQGYGEVDIDKKALAYYRYERIIQDIAEFCKQLLLTIAGGEDREQSYKYFTSSFLPGHVVEAALRTDQLAGID